MDNKIDQYIMNEQNSQMSQDKLDEMAEQNLGRGKMSDSLQRLAQIKGWSVKGCQVCGEKLAVKDSRQLVVLCRNHMGLNAVVSNMLSKRKQQQLKPEDIQNLINTRTVRTGPFWNPADPTGELRKKGIIK